MSVTRVNRAVTRVNQSRVLIFNKTDLRNPARKDLFIYKEPFFTKWRRFKLKRGNRAWLEES